MDPKTESALPLSVRQPGDLVCSPSKCPTEMTVSEPDRQMEQAISDYIEEPVSLKKPTEPSSDLASCPAQEAISDLNCRPSEETVPLGYDFTGGVPLSSEGALITEVVPSVFPHQLNASVICTYESICSTESVTGLAGVDTLRSNDGPDVSIKNKSIIDRDCHIQDNRTTKVYSTVAPTPVTLTEQPSVEPVPDYCSSSTQDTTTSDRLRPLSALSDSSKEISTVTEPLPDLYIFESDMQEFVPSPCEIRFFNRLPLSQDTQSDVDRKVPVPISCRHQARTAFTSARNGRLTSAGDGHQDDADGSVVDRQRNSPSELWLDACQYLAGQDTGSIGNRDQANLDDPGHSMLKEVIWASGDTSVPPEVTGVSDYLPEEDDAIGWSSNDIAGWGTPVERWSSVDSWASALSDWAAIIAAPAEDISASFTEIGAEIEALTQALAESRVDTQQDPDTEDTQVESEARPQTQTLMAIQDQALKPQPSAASSVQTGQSVLTGSLSDPAGLSGLAEVRDRRGAQIEDSHLTEPLPFPRDGKEAAGIQSTTDECCLLPTGSATTSWAFLGETSVSPSSAASLEGMDTDCNTRNNEEPVLLHISEDTDDGMDIEEPIGAGLCQVTAEPSVSQPGLAAEQGGDSCGAPGLSVSGYSSYQAETLKVDNQGAGGSRPLAGLQDLSPGDLTSAHAPTPEECHQPCQDQLQWAVPQFVVPLAPLTIGQPLLCQTDTTLEGDHVCAERSVTDNKCHSCYHEPQELWPTFEGINETPSESHEDKELIYKEKSTLTCAEKRVTDDGKVDLTSHTSQSLNNSLYDVKLHSEDTPQFFLSDKTTTNSQEIQELSRELANLAIVSLDDLLFSEKHRVAYITLDLNDPLILSPPRPITPKALQSDQSTNQPESNPKKPSEMPHKKSTTECKTRSRKEKSAGCFQAGQASKKQDNVTHHTPIQQPSKIQDSHVSVGGALIQCNAQTVHEGKENVSVCVMEPTAVAERVTTKPQGKKKKKHSQNVTAVKSEAEPQAKEENGANQKTARGNSDALEVKLSAIAGKSKDKTTVIPSKKDVAQTHSAQRKAQVPAIKTRQATQPPCDGTPNEFPPAAQLNDDVIKRRRLSEDKFGKMVSAFESKLAKAEGSIGAKRDKHKAATETCRKKAYSEVVKQTSHTHTEEPKVVQPIQPTSVNEDPQSLCLWCQFSAVLADYTVTWSREGTVLADIKRSSGDESRVSVTISKASHKDLGRYRCCLTSPHGSVTLEYVLTYEALSEIVIPASSKPLPPDPVEVEVEEEDVHCSRLLFREDFLSEQYFGDNQHASIVTEKVHFGEGMHRKAFRTKLQGGLVPKLSPGHPCVLKVHNSISYGTNNNEELVQKNFNLAVEECQVQNTAREYIKAYNDVAQSSESFGEVPIIIPIYLVHRPSNDIPYATLEEELIGDFVKYSVRDGKEINLMRRDSEAGQKCCAFQHWVYHKTDGNLLVTDMQGVGMKLTDVGIATSKKGYKGFKGNCATSFIDQFKALHQCNKYCELLGLTSLQPKPKRPVGAPKPIAQVPATPKKKTFGPTVKGKS